MTIDRRYYLRLVQEVIRQFAQEGNAVIVGRGGQAILRAHPRALHVCIRAPRQDRVERCQRAGVGTYRACERMVDESDRRRSSYLRSFYGVDWLEPDLYDLILNTGKLTVHDATQTIVACARALEVQPS